MRQLLNRQFLSRLFKGNPEAVGELWETLSKRRGGTALFSMLIWIISPHTGIVFPWFAELRPGYCVAYMNDRWWKRNFMGGLHMASLLNFAEAVGNLALVRRLGDDAQFTVTNAHIAYLKKARGRIKAVCHMVSSSIQTFTENTPLSVDVALYNKAGDTVAKVNLTTVVGPRKKK